MNEKAVQPEGYGPRRPGRYADRAGAAPGAGRRRVPPGEVQDADHDGAGDQGRWSDPAEQRRRGVA